MKLSKLIDRYVLGKSPVLKVVNPRIGTSLIPLDTTDGEIFLQYLTNKVHALYFDGTEIQLKQLIMRLSEEKNLTIQKIRTSSGRRNGRLMLVHLKSSNNIEIRRVIQIT